MYHISAASTLLSRSFVSVQQKDGPYVGFQGVGFYVNSDISVGEDGLHLGERVVRQSYSFLDFCFAFGVWSYCESQVFKGANLFYSFFIAGHDTPYLQLCLQISFLGKPIGCPSTPIKWLTAKEGEKERERERQTDTDRERQRERQRQTEIETKTETTDKQTETERQRWRQTEGNK